MKKVIFILILSPLLFSHFNLIAQSWVNGGNNLSADGRVGLISNHSLIFITNNTERSRLTYNGNWGIGTGSPGSKLAVNSASGSSPFIAQINGSTKFYASSGGGLSVGSGSTPPSNGLYVSGNAGIGTSTPSYKLHVVSSGTAIYGNSTAGGFGVYGNSTYLGVYGVGATYGVYGYTGSSSSGTGVYGSGYYGVYGNGGTYGVYGSGSSYGLYGTSSNGYGISGTGYDGLYGSSNNTSGYGAVTYGGYGGTYGSGSQYGLYGYSGTEYGVYGYTGGNGTNETGVYGYCASYGYGVRGNSVYGSGIYGSGGAYAGYFSGNVYCTGSYLGSDRKLKKNIVDMESGMDLISKLQPKTYEFRQDGNYKLMHLPEGKHYGLIAQDLEQILPNLVKDTKFDTV